MDLASPAVSGTPVYANGLNNSFSDSQIFYTRTDRQAKKTTLTVARKRGDRTYKRTPWQQQTSLRIPHTPNNLIICSRFSSGLVREFPKLYLKSLLHALWLTAKSCAQLRGEKKNV